MNWLVINVVPTAVHTAVGTVAGALTMALIVVPFRKVFKKLGRAVDSIDPDTDTGVTKQLREIKEATRATHTQTHAVRK